MAHHTTGYCPVNARFDLSIIAPQVDLGIVDDRYRSKGYGHKSGRKCAGCGFDVARYPIHDGNKCFKCMSEANVMEIDQDRAQALANYFAKQIGVKATSERVSVPLRALRNAAKGKADRPTIKALFRLSREWSVTEICRD
jgi:hypothetical protein